MQITHKKHANSKIEVKVYLTRSEKYQVKEQLNVKSGIFDYHDFEYLPSDESRLKIKGDVSDIKWLLITSVQDHGNDYRVKYLENLEKLNDS